MLAMRDMELVVASTRRSHGSTGLRVTSLLDHYRPQERRVRDGGDASETMLAATPGRGRPPSAYGTRGTPIGAADRPCPQARRRAFRPGSSTASDEVEAVESLLVRGRVGFRRAYAEALQCARATRHRGRRARSSGHVAHGIRRRASRVVPCRAACAGTPSAERASAKSSNGRCGHRRSRSACCSPALQRRPTSPSVGHSAVAAMLPTGIEPVHAV
jgi:hypothetical protein